MHGVRKELSERRFMTTSSLKGIQGRRAAGMLSGAALPDAFGGGFPGGPLFPIHSYRLAGHTARCIRRSPFAPARLPDRPGGARRSESWSIMRIRSDVVFLLLTKRPERVRKCLPEDWGDGWNNIFLNVTCEYQRRADDMKEKGKPSGVMRIEQHRCRDCITQTGIICL